MKDTAIQEYKSTTWWHWVRPRLFVAACVAVLGMCLILPLLVAPANAAQGEQTAQALATTEFAQQCGTRWLVTVRQINSINGQPINGLNIRSAPVTGAVVGTVNSNSGQLHAAELRGGWYRLCSVEPKWISGSAQYVVAVAVTPTPTAQPATATPTPTRIPPGGDVGSRVTVVLRGVKYPLKEGEDCVRTEAGLECLVEIWVVVEEGDK